MNHYIAITRNEEGKIVIFDKYTDDFDAFYSEVEGWGNDMLSVYCEDAVVGRCTL